MVNIRESQEENITEETVRRTDGRMDSHIRAIHQHRVEQRQPRDNIGISSITITLKSAIVVGSSSAAIQNPLS